MDRNAIINKHTVPPGTTRARLGDYCVGLFPELPSRKGTKKAISRGAILLNGETGKTGDWVESGMHIELCELDQAPRFILPLQLSVVYEDEHIALINKPGGIPVSGNSGRTLEQALLHNIQPSSLPDAYQQPRAAHRLDSPTCGLVLIAKTRSARIYLGDQFEVKQIEKTYQAIVIGQTVAEGRITEPIDNKQAITEFQLLKSVRSLHTDWISLLWLKPKTGRTHQIRRHLANAGFPVLGDKEYGNPGEIMRGKGLFLCATALTFEHPSTKQTMSFSIEPPSKFHIHLEREQRRWERYYLRRQA